MGLAERIAAGAPVRQSRVEKQIIQLLPEEQTALVSAALDPEWSDEALVRVLQDEGLIVGLDAFSSWRAKVRELGTIPAPIPGPVVEPPVDLPPVVEDVRP